MNVSQKVQLAALEVMENNTHGGPPSCPQRQFNPNSEKAL